MSEPKEAKKTELTLHISGNAEKEHPAERCLLAIMVRTKGPKKAVLAEEANAAAMTLERLLRQLSAQDKSPESFAAAAIAHWARTSFSTRDDISHDFRSSSMKTMQYETSITFDVRFKDFSTLGYFNKTISALPLVEVRGVAWDWTPATTKSINSTLRKEAAQDALSKATEFCQALGCSRLRPTSLHDESRNGGDVTNDGSTMHMRMLSKMAVSPTMEDMNFQPHMLKKTLTIQMEFCAEPGVTL